MEPLNGDNMFRPRSYQLEMLEESLERNIVVAMDTGSGKTHIAVLRIKAELERCLPSQMVWFLAPAVALCYQQYEVLQLNLPGVQCRLLCGNDDVDHWSDCRLWDAVFENIRVVVSTPKILLDALSHGFLNLNRLALIVFDEAHNVIRKSPANQIMQLFYHARQREEVDPTLPHILGLTASPIMNVSSVALEALERNLNAITKTPKLCRTELLQYVHRPELEPVIYSTELQASFYEPTELLLFKRLQDALQYYDITNDPYVLELKKRTDPASLAKLEEALASQKTHCYCQLKSLHQRARTILRDLGPGPLEWYLYSCFDRFRKRWVLPGLLSQDLDGAEKTHLSRIFDDIIPPDRHPLSESILVQSISFKVEKLVKLLVSQSSSNFVGLVFVQQRATVAALSHLLAAIPMLRERFTVGSFVGMSSYSGRSSDIHDLADIKNQQGVLLDFKENRTNLVVSTNALEEGIDISACNVVICFDPPMNLISYLQRRGRARKTESKYFVFVDESSNVADVSKWSALEEQMVEAYLADRKLVEAKRDQEDVDEDGDMQKRIKATGALLTLENAVAHLYHFCQKLASGSFLDPRPEFAYCENQGAIKATVRLPTSVDESVRAMASTYSWKTERNARKDAAFTMCVALHGKGLLNDHLLPLFRNELADIEALRIRNQPSLCPVAHVYNPWIGIARKWTGASNLYSSTLTLTSDAGETTIMRMLLPVSAPNVEDFTLYLNENSKYVVQVEQSAKQETVDLCVLRDISGCLLSCVESQRESKMSDFVALFAPSLEPNDLRSWYNSVKDVLTVEEAKSSGVAYEQLGVVRDQRMFGARYFAQGFSVAKPSRIHHGRLEDHSSKSETVLQHQNRIHANQEERLTPDVTFQKFEACADHEQLCVEARKVPKRRDFLHKVLNTDVAVATSSTLLPAESCTIDKLPAQYALFARFIPSIMHRYEVRMIAEELQGTALAPVGISNLNLVLTALCSRSAREEDDYERLEFLGDCILKFYVSFHLMVTHTMWPESYLTAKKSQMVSNSTLTAACLSLGIDKFIITKAFTGTRWTPMYIQELLKLPIPQSREMSSKQLADVVEALIGASFIDEKLESRHKGLEKSLRCLQLFFPDTNWEPVDIMCKGLQDRAPMENRQLDEVERLLGYTFIKKSLSVEALTHGSYNLCAGARSYQRLEFLGDAILDYLVVAELFDHTAQFPHYEMHLIRTALVNADFLAFLCMENFVEQTRKDVVLVERSHTFETLDAKVQHHLWQFMRHSSPDITKAWQTAQKRHQLFRGEIITALEQGPSYPWAALASVNADKFFSDIIESLVAAIYIDSTNSFEACYGMLDKLGLMGYMRRILREKLHLLHPKEELGQLADTEKVNYEVDHTSDRGFCCKVFIGDALITSVEDGISRIAVESRAAEDAVRKLKEVLTAGNDTP